MYLQSIVSCNLIIYFFHNIKKLFVSSLIKLSLKYYMPNF